MKRILLAGATLLALTAAQPTLAADAPVYKGPAPVAAAPIFNWSGFYAGGSLGGVWSQVDRFYPQAIGGALTATTSDTDGIWGLHVGAQGQWGQWVLGIEASFSRGFNDMRGRAALPTPPFAADTSGRNTITNLFLIGPRLGFAGDRWMVYGTGGYAQGRVGAEYAFTSTDADRFLAFWGSATNNGWFAGLGIEYALWTTGGFAWIFGAEYIHFDLGSAATFCFNPGCAPINAEDYRNRARGDIIRARLSIKTGG